MPADARAVAIWLGLLCCGWVLAAPVAPPTSLPDSELLEFLGSFETKTGDWPELNEALAQALPDSPAPPPPPKEEATR